MNWLVAILLGIAEGLEAQRRRARLAHDLERLSSHAPRRARRVPDAVDVSPRALLPPRT